MAKTRVNATEPALGKLPQFEQVFQRLPPLGSDAYPAHIQPPAAPDPAPETGAEFDPEAEEDPLSLVCEPPAWHGHADPERVMKIEEIIRTVISQIPHEYIRELATAPWLRSKRPKVSRTAATPGEELA